MAVEARSYAAFTAEEEAALVLEVEVVEVLTLDFGRAALAVVWAAAAISTAITLAASTYCFVAAWRGAIGSDCN